MVMSKLNIQRSKAAFIFLLPIVVLLVSTAIFFIGLSPDGRTNNGVLIDPPIDLKSLDLKLGTGPLNKEYPGKWSVLHFVINDCPEGCWDSLYKARQVHIRLSKDGNRLVRYLIKTENVSFEEIDLDKLKEEYPRLYMGNIDSKDLPEELLKLDSEGAYILFDPLGNGFMLYEKSLPGGELLEDLKKLLKNSKIG